MFQFSLGSILNHRKILEETRQKELGVLKRKYAEERKKYNDMKSALDRASRELKINQEKNMTVSQAGLFITYLGELSKQMNAQRKVIMEVEAEIDCKREELLVAMKNRKIIENLKARKLRIYNKQMLKKELAFMNEMAAVRCNPDSAE